MNIIVEENIDSLRDSGDYIPILSTPKYKTRCSTPPVLANKIF